MRAQGLVIQAAVPGAVIEVRRAVYQRRRAIAPGPPARRAIARSTDRVAAAATARHTDREAVAAQIAAECDGGGSRDWGAGQRLRSLCVGGLGDSL